MRKNSPILLRADRIHVLHDTRATSLRESNLGEIYPVMSDCNRRISPKDGPACRMVQMWISNEFGDQEATKDVKLVSNGTMEYPLPELIVGNTRDVLDDLAGKSVTKSQSATHFSEARVLQDGDVISTIP